MNWEVFITCAVTGAGDTIGKSSKVPITPKQIADSAIEAAQVGAAIVHIHVRDPENGGPSRDLSLYREVVERVRASNTDVVINLTLHTDLRAAGQSDDLDDTVNYRTVTKQVIEHVEQSEYLLVEKLAEQVAAICLGLGGVSEVDVSIDKPGALRFTRSVSVEISRSRTDG